MTLRGLSPKTKQAYVNAVAGLAKYYNQSPDQLNGEQIQSYLLYLIKERRLAWSSCNIVFSALRCFYTNILKWDGIRLYLPSRPRQHQLPVVLSEQEVKRLLEATPNLKHKALLMTVYGGGLRVSEVIRLKPCHIESDRMVIRVEQGKGKKDRYTLLSETLLYQLRIYWKAYCPGTWLFPGRNRDRPMAISTAQRIYYLAKEAAGITKGRGIHTLRHCFATHLLNQGVDIHLINRMMGHRSLGTTAKYLHTTPHQMGSVKSPLDRLYTDN
jgi:site-specific recombinase XerD